MMLVAGRKDAAAPAVSGYLCAAHTDLPRPRHGRRRRFDGRKDKKCAVGNWIRAGRGGSRPNLSMLARPDKDQGSGNGGLVMAAGFSFFRCPHCEARYHLVKVEADPESTVGMIICRACGGRLSPREGKFALKYFLLDKRPRPRRAAPRRRSGNPLTRPYAGHD